MAVATASLAVVITIGGRARRDVAGIILSVKNAAIGELRVMMVGWADGSWALNGTAMVRGVPAVGEG